MTMLLELELDDFVTKLDDEREDDSEEDDGDDNDELDFVTQEESDDVDTVWLDDSSSISKRNAVSSPDPS